MLTNSELKQIKDYLALYGKKDSQLEAINVDLDYPEVTFKAKDYLSVVQDSKNKTIKIKDLEKVFLLTFLTDEDFREALKGKIPEEMLENACVTTEKLADGAVTTIKLGNNAITTAKIATSAITGEKIANNTIQGAAFAANSITTDKIVDGTVTGDKLADGSIQSVDIKDNTLSGSKFVDGSIGGSKIQDDAIESKHLLDNSIPASKIKDGSIESVDIKDGTLDGSKIKDNTIESAKLANSAITADKIIDNSITTSKIANDAVTEDKIVDDSITTAKIANSSVTTDKIVDEAITEDKLANGAVTTAKLADGLISEIQNITDATPTTGSVKPVQSGGVKTAIDNVAFLTNEKVNTVGIDDEPTAGSDNLVKSGGVYETKNQLSLNPINEGKIISNPSTGDYITNLGVSLIKNHTYKIVLTFLNSGTFSDSASFKLMTMQSASNVATLAHIDNSDITPGTYEYELKWNEDSVINYRAGFYAGSANDQAIIVGATTSIQDITLSEYAEREASIDSVLNLYGELNKLSTNPPTRIGFLSIHGGKINITDSSITFPANTRVLYGESGYSYSSTQSQETTLTRDSNYEQWICFNITSKIFVARTIGFLQADDYVLFVIQNHNSIVRHNITLAPSLYTYDGKPEYAPKSSDLLTSQSYSASQKEQILTNLGLGGVIGVDSYPKSGGNGVVKSGDLYDWVSKLSVGSYPMKYGQIESIPTAYKTYFAITGLTLTKNHKYKATVIAGTPFTGPQYFSLKAMTSSSDTNIFTILSLAGVEVSTNTAEFIWDLDSGEGFRLGFYGGASVSTTISVIIEDITIDTFQHENFSWNIINRNKHKETSLIATTAYSGTTNIKTANKLTLLHLSDLHGNTSNLANIVLFRDYYQDYLDDTIHTGDAVQYTINNPNPFETVTGADTILNVVGNHEAWLSPSDTDYNATELQTYNKILATNISLWDVTQPTDAAENGYCYYYKDYDIAGIRLIIIDSVHWHTRNGIDQSNAAQKTWLESTLEDARTNNLKVICATHYTPVNGVTLVSDTGFTDFVPSTGIVGDGWFANDEIFTCVDVFITNGGNFLGWIMGHVHNDFFGKVTGHSLQPTVIIGTAGAGSPGAESNYNKFISGTSSQDNFNIVTFETKDDKNYIKVTKIGNDRNIYGRSKNSLSFNTTDWTLIYTD